MFKWIVENEIAVSSFPTRSSILDAREKGIRAVISLTKNPIDKDILPDDMEYRHFPVQKIDKFDVREFLLYASFLKKVHFPFLVHCKDGILRSPFFALLYLLYTGHTNDEVKKLVYGDREPEFTEEYASFLKDFNDNIVLYYLNGNLTSYFYFHELIKLLRHQCPWDKEQTHESLIPELIEESLELAEAIKKNNFNGMREELGDVLLQVVLHSVIAEQEGKFNMEGVIDEIFEKMYRRHPHVFGYTSVNNSKQVLEQWEDIKKKEKKRSSVDIAKVLASLIVAFSVQEEARKEGFDFTDKKQILEKISEETEELKAAIAQKQNVSVELGDLLFSVINLARFLEIDPAHALFLSIDKFRKRFNFVKDSAKGRLHAMSENEKDALWRKAKKREQ
jgi:tetrapyrrole methylase family protein/MazG family protein